MRACDGGEEALAGAREMRPDVVFVDITMPDVDGLAVIAQIPREPSGERAWICTVSGHDRAPEAGADEHLGKRIGVGELRKALEHAAERQSDGAGRDDAAR